MFEIRLFLSAIESGNSLNNKLYFDHGCIVLKPREFFDDISYVAPIYTIGQTPEIGIPPSYRATRRYTKVHLGFCLRFSTLIGQRGRVPLFGAGPRRYIRSRLFRLAVTAFWRAFTGSWRQKGKRKEIFPRAVRTTALPSNPAPLTFRNNQIQI